MSCKLIRDIKHSCEYNAGGIKSIYLLDIEDFISYQFLEDGLYNTSYVDQILENYESFYYLLDTVEASNFTETEENGIYKQELTTFVHTLNFEKTSDLLLVGRNKYVVVFGTYQDTYFTFGSDGGASVSFSQITGQQGESTGYNITITKNSIYPLFEVNKDKFNKAFVLGSEAREIISTEDEKNAILI